MTAPMMVEVRPGQMLGYAAGPVKVWGFYSGTGQRDMIGAWVGTAIEAPCGATHCSIREPYPSEQALYLQQDQSTRLDNSRPYGRDRAGVVFADPPTPAPDHHLNPVDPADVLAYVTANYTAEEDGDAAAFVQSAAFLVARGANYRDFGMEGFAAFVEWCDERPRVSSKEPMSFLYRNWRGEEAVRRAYPLRVFFGSTEWHPEDGYLLEAIDADKREVRTFALKDMAFFGAPVPIQVGVIRADRIKAGCITPIRLTPQEIDITVKPGGGLNVERKVCPICQSGGVRHSGPCYFVPAEPAPNDGDVTDTLDSLARFGAKDRG